MTAYPRRIYSSLSASITSLPAVSALAVVFVGLLLLSGCAGKKPDPTRDWPADRLYYAAREQLEDKRYEKAIDYYQKLDARYPYGRLAQQGKIEIAYAHWKNDDPASALAACDRFLREHPNHFNVDYVYYLKGRINHNDDLGWMAFVYKIDPTERDPVAAREAYEAFKELVSRFPQSKYADDARARMTYLVNALASYETTVAEYYFRQGAYVASVSRAQEIVTTYPRAPAVERALAIMVASYEEMGLEELRSGAERTLRANFPDSKVKVQARRSAWWRLW